ncbi:MAG: hypothetical protein C4346_00215 [Chloroflexota bacterium]
MRAILGHDHRHLLSLVGHLFPHRDQPGIEVVTVKPTRRQPNGPIGDCRVLNWHVVRMSPPAKRGGKIKINAVEAGLAGRSMDLTHANHWRAERGERERGAKHRAFHPTCVACGSFAIATCQVR